MADNNPTDVTKLLNENTGSDSTSSGDGSINDVEDGPVENKFNEYTSYWDPIKEEFTMSTDTPTVQIYISREIVPESTEEEEVELVDDALTTSYDMSVAYRNSDVKNGALSVVNTSNGAYLAMNAVDKHNIK